MKPAIVINTEFNDYGEIVKTIITRGPNTTTINIYNKEIPITIEKAFSLYDKLREIFLRSYNDNIIIACNDFKSHIKALNLPLVTEHNIYQIDQNSTDDLKEYQRLVAQSSVVYQHLENNGLYRNYEHVKPLYDSNTFTGRSRTKSFNIQGYTDSDSIRTTHSNVNDVILWFDWVSADIRVAAELSDDDELRKAFIYSDPYEYMADAINKQIEEGKVSREECKDFMLRAINSLSIDNELLNVVYPKLSGWLRRLFLSNDENFSLTTLLGKKFDITNSKNKLAVINGSMQGSVVHAMQGTLVKLYNKIPNNIICEIHDSIAISCPNNSVAIKDMISIVKDAMLYPIGDGIVFPFKVSVGKKWRQWRHIKTFR